jgi:hypothetical protein
MSSSFQSMLTLALCVITFSLGYVLPGAGFAAEDADEVSVALPSSVDLRPKLEKWGLAQRKQGGRGTCSVFTVVEAVEFACAAESDKGSPLSVEFANWAANEATGRGDDGDFFHNIIRGIKKHGICREASMPYAADYAPDKKPESDAVREAAEFQQTTRLEFRWIRSLRAKPGLSDDDVRTIKSTMAKGFPVGAGSYHSVLLVGYKDDPALDGGGAFLIADSNRREKEITYKAARARFGDMFWVRATKDTPKADTGSKSI